MKNEIITATLLLSLTACSNSNTSTSESKEQNTQLFNSENVVEVMLTSNLDNDERGYCLDIAGGKGAKAPLDKGLQAHTCYHYTGGILEDQGFDPALVNEGQFKIPFFDVCMSAASIEIGASLNLMKCDQSDNQKFSLNADGQLVTQLNPSLCVTVNGTEKKEGRGGAPVHVMRPISLQTCDAANKDYQTWTLNSI